MIKETNIMVSSIGLTFHTARRGALLLGALLILLVAGAAQAHADFGVVPGSFTASITDQEGHEYTQAGGHPFAATTSFALNTKENETPYPPLDQNVKDIVVDLPAGLAGNPQAVPACTEAELEESFLTVACPIGSQVGVAELALAQNEIADNVIRVPIFNVTPKRNEVAAFGFLFITVSTHISASVRSDSDYGLQITISGVSSDVDLHASKITFWGVPADPAHDPERGETCFGGGEFCSGGGQSAGIPPKPFLTLPSDCSHGPYTTSLAIDSYQDPSRVLKYSSSTPTGVTGCEKPLFAPSISVQPDNSQAGSPAGYDVDLSLPQNENPKAVASADLRKAVVSLPAGVRVSPSAADGLEGCSDAQIGIGSNSEPTCPLGAKIGDLTLTTPLLAEPMTGSIYLGTQTPTQLLRLFLVAHGPGGLIVKLAGRVDPDPVTGQLTATFDENPQLPFSDLSLHFKNGPRAPLTNPSSCGTFSASAQLTSWDDALPVVAPSSSFTIDQGCSTGGFAPSFSAGTVSPAAGAFSPFSVSFSRSDADQDLGSITVRAPEGLLGVLKSVPLCGEPQAAEGTCGAGSMIGHTTVGAGPGSNPFYLGGNVYLTGPYKGAPFGLSIAVPAIAGPFNLGTVVVRAAIAVDPNTAALTITSDPLPSILQGIPLQIRSVNVTVDRAGFMFNPTDCSPLLITGTIASAQGASAAVSNHFQAANCAALAFKPKFSASVAGKSSRANGAALDVKISSGAGQANIGRVAVSLPKALPSRLKTIQKACPQATFAASPGSCPAGSLVGTGTAVTPVLALPLSGPAYLVSHGGAAFPDLVVVLQGRGEAAGVTIDLKGAIDITKAGVTSSTFSNVPDVPISSFELQLPTGPHSALTGNLPAKAKGSFCGQTLTMPTALTGQNGTQVKQSTKIAVSGCTTSRAKKKAKKAKAVKKTVKKG